MRLYTKRMAAVGGAANAIPKTRVRNVVGGRVQRPERVGRSIFVAQYQNVAEHKAHFRGNLGSVFARGDAFSCAFGDDELDGSGRAGGIFIL